MGEKFTSLVVAMINTLAIDFTVLILKHLNGLVHSPSDQFLALGEHVIRGKSLLESWGTTFVPN